MEEYMKLGSNPTRNYLNSATDRLHTLDIAAKSEFYARSRCMYKPKKLLIKEEPLALQAAPRGSASLLQPRFIFIAPDRPQMYNQTPFSPQGQGQAEPNAIVLSRNGIKQIKLGEATDRNEIPFPPPSFRDFVALDAQDDAMLNQRTPSMKYASEAGTEEDSLEGMGRQGLNPFSLLSSVLGGGGSRENRSDRDQRPREQGLLNGLLTLPEIFLSIT
ncbi:unnamed protein product [Bemisia tabaci]|uniref:Uncharacterized protein n=1 Tax=Bemisia tabaci TaxID=7038 RepID=A0A9P0F4H6_BEMTA|nr:unnamed protein product [Bemisia tabaci]